MDWTGTGPRIKLKDIKDFLQWVFRNDALGKRADTVAAVILGVMSRAILLLITVVTLTSFILTIALADAINPGVQSLSSEEVSLGRSGDLYTVPVQINSQMTIPFIIDSGASDVSIPADVMLTLVRTETLKDGDFIGSQIYTLADGSTTPSLRFIIRKLKVGDQIIENVTAKISDIKGLPLLGQSFLSKFKSWTIDNSRRVLVLNQPPVEDLIAAAVQRCWYDDPGTRGNREMSAVIKIWVGVHGIAERTEIIDQRGAMSDPIWRAFAERARRAPLNPNCSKLPIPENKLEQYRVVTITITPQGVQ